MRKEKEELKFRRGDAVASAAVVLLAGIILAVFWAVTARTGKVTARIYLNGTVIRELSLEEDLEIRVEGAYVNTVTVRDGQIAVTESDCPGEDCVHSGWIRSPGRSIVCLPNRMEIRLEGTEDGGEVDAVAQ